MTWGFSKVACLGVALGVMAYVPVAIGKKKISLPPTVMDEHQRAVHALNRLAFGPRAGDIDRVMSIGVDKWIDEQLHPSSIDDGALAARLSSLRTLQMSTRELVENFPPPQLIRAIADGKQSLPNDPVKRAVYQAQLARYEQKQERKQQAGAVANQEASKTTNSDDVAPNDQTAQQLLEMSPDQREQEFLKISPEERLAVMASLKNRREEFLDGMTPQQRETVMALNNPQQVVDNELVEAKLLRATYSERQLQEVMTDFWLNHFNVFIGKGADHYLLTSYERDVIRPHTMGKFEDLLDAVAQSPAMLFYLDNWLSVGPNSDFASGIPKRTNARKNGPVSQARGKRSGLNENYGRELMELHTLGVNGGYTQKDVTEVARVFTGWTLKQPRQSSEFHFDERMHEPGDKTVLGHRIKPKGQKEGLEVLRILAHHPATASFICNKLAMRFVSDDPPPALVDRMSQVFLKKDGDIREVLKTMFTSPEFWAADAYRAKVKSPFEFVISALRVSGAEIDNAMPLARQIQNLGMPLYGAQPPTGYSMKASAWVSSSALLGRMNFALSLTGGRVKGTQLDSFSPSPAPSDPQEILAALENRMLGGDVSRQTHETIAARLSDVKISQRKLDDPARPPNLAVIEGLLLGSPEFQRR